MGRQHEVPAVCVGQNLPPGGGGAHRSPSGKEKKGAASFSLWRDPTRCDPPPQRGRGARRGVGSRGPTHPPTQPPPPPLVGLPTVKRSLLREHRHWQSPMVAHTPNHRPPPARCFQNKFAGIFRDVMIFSGNLSYIKHIARIRQEKSLRTLIITLKKNWHQWHRILDASNQLTQNIGKPHPKPFFVPVSRGV